MAHTELAIQEDAKGAISVRGLILQAAPNEADALSYSFEGNANRAIAEHKLNTTSSRSHCIFTIHISSRSRVESEGHTIHSKLNCVDLAGSERLSKSGSEGQLMKEAMYINKSLTFLEQVVLALSTAGRDHVPYRQAKLTNLLKDSLGGNCKTSMVAAVWAEEVHMEETISTLKFGTRMMRVQNEATVNVSIPPEIQIRKLQKEVSELKAELNMQNQLRGKQGITYGEDFDDDERFELQREVRGFIEGRTQEMEVKNIRQVKEMFRIFKAFVENAEAEASAKLQSNAHAAPTAAVAGKKPGDRKASTMDGVGEVEGAMGFSIGTAVPAKIERHEKRPNTKENGHHNDGADGHHAAGRGMEHITGIEMPDRNAVFEDYKQTEGSECSAVVRQTQIALRDRKKQLRDVSVQVNDYKLRIDELRLTLEQKVQDREAYGEPGEVVDEEEFHLLHELREIKQKYRTAYESMQEFKTARDYEERMLEQARSKLLLDFETWYSRAYGVAFPHGGHGSGLSMPPIGGGGVVSQRQTRIEDDLEDPESATFYKARKVAQAHQHTHKGSGPRRR
jgi:kinesin family protein 6/9